MKGFFFFLINAFMAVFEIDANSLRNRDLTTCAVHYDNLCVDVNIVIILYWCKVQPFFVCVCRQAHTFMSVFLSSC